MNAFKSVFALTLLAVTSGLSAHAADPRPRTGYFKCFRDNLSSTMADRTDRAYFKQVEGNRWVGNIYYSPRVFGRNRWTGVQRFHWTDSTNSAGLPTIAIQSDSSSSVQYRIEALDRYRLNEFIGSSTLDLPTTSLICDFNNDENGPFSYDLRWLPSNVDTSGIRELLDY